VEIRKKSSKYIPVLDRSPMLSIVIPAYNEEAYIAATIDAIYRSFQSLTHELEIIVVDDGSVDKTAQIVGSLITAYDKRISFRLIQNQINQGKGFSIKNGVLAARGDKIIFLDADLPFDIDSIKNLALRISEEMPIVIGSRVLPESHISVKKSWFRFLSGRIYSVLIQLLMFPNIPDTQCGLKGFTPSYVKEVFPFLTINGFAFDVELLYISRKKNKKILQVPVKMISDRSESRLNMALDPLLMFMALFKIRLNDLMGKYE
jgi:dolichyl-phosphate beta-glucosyltransferase